MESTLKTRLSLITGTTGRLERVLVFFSVVFFLVEAEAGSGRRAVCPRQRRVHQIASI